MEMLSDTSQIYRMALQLFGVVPCTMKKEDIEWLWFDSYRDYIEYYGMYTPDCSSASCDVEWFLQSLRATEQVQSYAPIFAYSEKRMLPERKLLHYLDKVWNVPGALAPITKTKGLQPVVIIGVTWEGLEVKCREFLQRSREDPRARLPENYYKPQWKYVNMAMDLLNHLGVKMKASEITNPAARFAVIWRHLETGSEQVIDDSAELASLPKQPPISMVDILDSQVWENLGTRGDILQGIQELDPFDYLSSKSMDLFESNSSVDQAAYPYDPRHVLVAAIVRSGAPCETNSFLEEMPNVTMMAYIKDGHADISKAFAVYGVSRLATIFNRYKELFLAFKEGSASNRRVINQISRLSKKMPQLPLHTETWMTTSTLLTSIRVYNSHLHDWRAHPKLLQTKKPWSYLESNRKFLYFLEWLETIQNFVYSTTCRFRNRIRLYIPRNVVYYPLPFSESDMIGNIPSGTRLRIKSGILRFGIFCKNADHMLPIQLMVLDHSSSSSMSAGELKDCGYTIKRYYDKSNDGSGRYLVCVEADIIKNPKSTAIGINIPNCVNMDNLYMVLSTGTTEDTENVSEQGTVHDELQSVMSNVIVNTRFNLSRRGLSIIGHINHNASMKEFEVDLCLRSKHQENMLIKQNESPRLRFEENQPVYHYTRYPMTVGTAANTVLNPRVRADYNLSLDMISYDSVISLFDEFPKSII